MSPTERIATDDILKRHLRRTGADTTNLRDPYGQAQTSMLRLFLSVLQAALDDEHVEPRTAQRVIERVVYGAVPQPPASERLIELTGKLTEAVARQAVVMRFPVANLYDGVEPAENWLLPSGA